MKIKYYQLLALAIAFTTLTAQAQTQTNAAPPSITGGLGEIAQAIGNSTNWTAVTGYGRALSGNRSLAFADVAYNFNDNVGLIVGYDYLYGRAGAEANAVRGGITLSLRIHPFSFIGSGFFTNIAATPFVADLIAQPKGTAPIGNVAVTGFKFDLVNIKNFNLGLMTAYERRTGQGPWDANYGLVALAISRRF